MEINEFEDVLGVIPVEDVVEGRFVLLCAQTFTYDFGSLTDLPGVKLPDTADESKKARYILTWKVDNRSIPIYAVPSFTYAQRGGWDQTANTPFSTTVYVTHPGNQNCLTIPSGASSLAYTEGTFTVCSGCYIDSAEIKVVGANIIIANTAEDGAGDAGKPKYQAAMDDRVMGHTRFYNSTNGALTIRVL
jgi:hypothetical protein